jgi:hypothetical protein
VQYTNSLASEDLKILQVAEPFPYIARRSFVFSLAITVVVNLMTPLEPAEESRGLVFRYEEYPTCGKFAIATLVLQLIVYTIVWQSLCWHTGKAVAAPGVR